VRASVALPGRGGGRAERLIEIRAQRRLERRASSSAVSSAVARSVAATSSARSACCALLEAFGALPLGRGRFVRFGEPPAQALELGPARSTAA
jgi:hypothetical protein